MLNDDFLPFPLLSEMPSFLSVPTPASMELAVTDADADADDADAVGVDSGAILILA